MDTVWIVKDDSVVSVYKREKDAKNHYKERVGYYLGHNEPTKSDHWTYEETFKWVATKGDPYDATHFDAKCGFQKTNFVVSCSEYKIL